jgi:hypothetical protein
MVLMKEAASTSETSVNFYQTTLRYNPEDSHLHTHRCENLISHRAVSHYYELLGKHLEEYTTLGLTTRLLRSRKGHAEGCGEAHLLQKTTATNRQEILYYSDMHFRINKIYFHV